MKTVLIIAMAITSFISVSGFANTDSKMKMYYKNESVVKIIEHYSKTFGQKFIVDPSVRGLVSIFVQDPVGQEEAFNHLSTALALNGWAISKQNDTMVIGSGRNVQRGFLEVSTARPSLKPERMYTWVYNLKYASADKINKDVRILSSKDGEMNIVPDSNQIIFTDWTSNLNRVADILEKIDVKATK